MTDILYDLFRGEGSLVFNGKAIAAPTKVQFIESIYSPVRRGVCTVPDIGAVLEVLTGYTTNKNLNVELKLKNVYEVNGPFLRVPVELYNTKQIATLAQGVFQRGTTELSFEIIETPMFKEMTKKPISRVFRNKNAGEILQELLKDVIGIQNVDLIDTDIKPKIKSFISPYWNFQQIYEYLKYKVDGGPLMIFPVTENGIVRYKIATLRSIFQGEMGTAKKTVRAGYITKEAENYLVMRPDYRVKGPSLNIRNGYIQGESVISFDYFSGGLKGEERADHGRDTVDVTQKENAKFSYKDGITEYKNDKERYNKSVIAGCYEQGLKLFYNKGILGNYALLNKEDETIPNHKITIDLDDRSEVEAKMKSRFLEDMHNMVQLEATVVPHSGVILGGKYKIDITSSIDNKDNKQSKKDATLSGEWILVQIVHAIQKVERNSLEYVYLCTFARAGLGAEGSIKLENMKG
jgi:hypothetical protein